MKRSLALLLLLLISLSAFAVEKGEVLYVGGTIPTLKDGVVGKLDTSSPSVLTFVYPSDKLEIPYAAVDSFVYSQEVARHLGVLPAIAVGLVKKRQRRHFFRLSFHEGNNPPQVAVFEVPKDMPHALLAILQARAPQGCKPGTPAKSPSKPAIPSCLNL